jgi:hypothetical protein
MFVSTLIPPKRVKTGGSRERLNAWFVSWCVNGLTEATAGQKVTLGNSREPPV